MIISPPFLLEPIHGELDEDYVKRCMEMPSSGRGRFPVSSHLQWHGGMHVKAPAASDDSVRAIADGKVVYFRTPTEKPKEASQLHSHPLYHPREGWVDDGCVVIKHSTEIGEQETGPVDNEIDFYSIYMHLSKLESCVQTLNAKIHRKTRIGLPGQIYRDRDVFHFEIIADDAHFRKIAGSLIFGGRGSFITQDGRDKCCFGNMYFYLPDNTPIYSLNNGHYSATGNTIGQMLFLEMKYHRGKCTLTAMDELGRPIGQPVPLSSNTPAPNTEYTLYQDALKLYPDCPTAGFELLRFGRVLGDEPLRPTGAPHWREITYAGGTAWVNLNTDAIKKYSDADFPFWKGWQVDDTDADADSRCDSDIVENILNLGYGEPFSNLSDEDKVKRLCNPDTSGRLQHVFYKFPTEWQCDDAGFEARYGWIKEEVLSEDVDKDASMAWLKEHIKAQAFWDEANLGVQDNHWHLPPVAFIQQMRKCGWLSENEFKQLLPSHTIRANKFWERVNYDLSLIRTHRVSLNRAMRKYGINTPLRMAGFFGNALQETIWCQHVEEQNPNGWWYYPWHGRGFLQLTHAYNYLDYWLFRGRTVPTAFNQLVAQYTSVERHRPLADRVNQSHRFRDANFTALSGDIFVWRGHVGGKPLGTPESVFAPADSAGFYWVFGGMDQEADANHQLQRVQVNTNAGAKYYYRSIAFWRVSTIVNLPAVINRTNYNGLNGFDERCSAYGNLLAVLTEMRLPNANGQLVDEFPQGYTRRGIE